MSRATSEATSLMPVLNFHLGSLSAKATEIMENILFIDGLTSHEVSKLQWAEQQLSFVDAAQKRVADIEMALAEGTAATKAYHGAAAGPVQERNAFDVVCNLEARLKRASQSLDDETDPATFPQFAEHIEEVAQVSIQHDFVLRQFNRPASILRRVCAACGQPGRCVCISRREWDELRAAIEGPESVPENSEVYSEAWHELNDLQWQWEDEVEAQAANAGEDIDLYDGVN